MRGKLVVGNWKMNGGLASNATLLVAITGGWKARPDRQLAVCVPFPYFAQVRDLLAGSAVSWGAQDVSMHGAGAHTGEVSAGMVAEFGGRFAIVGHSERRAQHGETDAMVAAKARAALATGLTPIVCVGETLAEREAGQWHHVVGRQVDAAAHALGADLALAVLAYEPVWAIGTGKTAAPGQVQEVHAFLRERLERAGAPRLQVLYGGSVKAANAAALFAQPDVDGGLVGGASLDAAEFLAIANA
jgi:triosephosphate isomerase